MINYLKYIYDRSEDRKQKMIHKNDEDSDDVFMDKNKTEFEFEYKDDSDDENKKYFDELDDIISIKNVIKYIETTVYYEEIITKLSPILNYRINVKHESS